MFLYILLVVIRDAKNKTGRRQIDGKHGYPLIHRGPLQILKRSKHWVCGIGKNTKASRMYYFNFGIKCDSVQLKLRLIRSDYFISRSLSQRSPSWTNNGLAWWWRYKKCEKSYNLRSMICGKRSRGCDDLILWSSILVADVSTKILSQPWIINWFWHEWYYYIMLHRPKGKRH